MYNLIHILSILFSHAVLTYRFNCSKAKVCAKCAQPDHQDTACTSAIKCVNCNGEHTAYSKNCPRWITEKEIQRVRTERKISFPEARKIVEGVSKQPSFASVVAKQVVSVGCQTDAVEIRSATGATNVSQHLYPLHQNLIQAKIPPLPKNKL